MRKSYYDNYGGEDRAEGIGPDLWERSGKPAPYGDVPGEVTEALLADTSRRTPPARTKRTGAKRGGNRGVAIFALFVVLMLTLTGVGFYLRGATLNLPSLADVWDHLDPPDTWSGIVPWGDDDGDWDFYGYDDYDEDDWLSDLPKTTAERAPTEEGITLEVSPAPGKSLTAQEIYQKVNPAVVQVRSYLRNGYSLGTGVVMTEDGYIITNAHVIAGARQIDVVLPAGQRLRARLLGYDGGADLAVVKVEPQGLELTVAEFGDSSALTVGDVAYAIGNPLGSELRGTMTDGIISAIDRAVSTDGGEQTLLQTTAALNSGNSGGALINEYGQVVGITNMKMMSDYETIEGLGFAIPTSVVGPVVEQLISTGSYVGKPMLGITVVTVEAGEAEEGSPAGAYIYSVTRGSDAWKKGLREGDIITGANGEPVAATEDLLAIKNQLEIGDTIELEVWSNSRTRTVKVALVGSNSLNG